MSISGDFLPLLFFTIALVYSTVGFAGGSSYLLVLTLAGFPHTQSIPIALVCNLAVSSVGFWNFARAGHFRFRFILPFMVLSIPMAFVGSRIPIGNELFILLLSVCLAFAGLRLFVTRLVPIEPRLSEFRQLWFLGLPVGAMMGFLSGLVGIGGGIFLSPFLILNRLASIKEASAAASCFIFVNSLSGLIGKAQHGFILHGDWWMLVFPALCGGLVGSRLGSRRLPLIGLQRILAGLVLFISISLILKVL